MKFIITNNISQSIRANQKDKPVLLKGLPSDNQLSHISLPVDFFTTTSNFVDFLVNNKSLVDSYLNSYLNDSSTQADLWLQRALVFTDELQTICQFATPFKKKNHAIATWSYGILEKIAHTYFTITTEIHKRPLVMLPGIKIINNQQGFSTNPAVAEHYGHLIMIYHTIVESIEKEMCNTYRCVEKVNISDNECFMYSIESSIKHSKEIMQTALVTLLQLLEKTAPEEIIIENHTQTPLGSDLDMDFILHFAAQDYQLNITESDELVLQPY